MSHQLNKHDGTDAIVSIAGKGKVICFGPVPSDGSTGYAAGCLFFNESGNSVSTYWYVNEGDATSCNFDPITINS